MLSIVATWDDGPLQRRIATVISSLKDIPLTLRIMGAEVKKDSARRFAQGGPGWAPRKPVEQSDDARRAAATNTRARAERMVRTKLKSDLRRASRRRALGPTARTEAAADRRYEFLREFERQAAGGSEAYSLLSKKQTESLGKRIDRAYEAAESKPLLGRLASANQAKAEGDRAVVVRNVARNSKGEKFSAAHNDGDSRNPKREFLAVTPEVVGAVQQRLAAHFLRAWERGS